MKDTIGEQPHSSTCPVAMTALAAFLASAGAWPAAPVDAEVASGPRLYMAGDSIMTEYTPDWFPQYGWGQSLKSFMKKPENLHNFARSGWSARRFRESGRWEKRIASALKPGDWVIVSFGHNDMNKRRNKPPKNDYSTLDEYKAFLRGFAADARAKGANIAFATSIAHSAGFGEKDGVMSVDGGAKGLGPYVAVMRETAAELGVPLLDLNRYAEEKLPKMGLEKAKALYMYVKPGEYANYPKGKQDAAHVRDAGAYFYARAAVEMAREQKLPLADLWKDPASVQFVPSVSASNAALRVGPCDMRVAGRGFPVTAEWADSRLGTARAFGSNVLGPCVPYGSAHPSPDSLWPTPHQRARGSHHGFGAPTSGWWPGDKVVGFSQLHAQGTGGTPSYGIFRYVCDPQDMEILEAHPYLLKIRLKPSGLLVDVSSTHHGAVYRVRGEDGAPRALPLDRRCKLAKADCVNAAGEFTGNWNPAPYRCFAHSEVDDATGIHRIAVSFKSDEQARAYFAAELAGRTPDDVAKDSKRLWDETLSCISIEGVDDAERAHFYSILAQTFIQPRDRTADGIGWDDHYTLWDTWRTHFPLKAIIDPQTFAGNVNSFADRFARTGRCDACYTSGKEYKVGQGGDEADCVIAEAWAKKIPGIDWARVAPLLRSRWTGRTKGYRERGYVPSGEREDYCGRMKSGSATMNFAYQDWCCAQVLRGLGDAEMAERFLARSGNWTNVWDATAFDAPSGVRGFARARGKDGRFAKTDPRRGFNTDFYEANCWEYSFFVPHDMDGLIRRCGGRDAFERRVAYALENNLVAFDNEPSFMIPWLFAYTGRGDLATKWAPRVATLFKGLDLPGDNDSGAMCALYVFIQFGFFPVAGQDLYLMHGSAYPKIVIQPRGGGKTFTIRSVNYAKGRRVKSVTLNGKPHDPLFLRHAEIASGGELVFTYE